MKAQHLSLAPNITWTNVITLAAVSDGASSQGEQTLSINVTELPANGANYRVYKPLLMAMISLETLNLSLGENNINSRSCRI